MFEHICGDHRGACVAEGVLCIFLLFFNDTATTEIYTLSLHDALPISIYGWEMVAPWPMGRGRSSYAMDRTFVGTNRWRGVERRTRNISGLRIPRLSIWSATMRSCCNCAAKAVTPPICSELDVWRSPAYFVKTGVSISRPGYS